MTRREQLEAWLAQATRDNNELVMQELQEEIDRLED